MAPLVRRTWSPQGQPPVLPHRTRAHQKVSVIAALCVPPTRDHVHMYFWLHTNRNITATEVVAFLRQLHSHLNGTIVLLWDRFQAHRAKKVQTLLPPASRIHPVFFPPYAPELNTTEYAWGYLKGNPLANWAPLDLDQLVVGTRHSSQALQHRPDLLRYFIRHSPLFCVSTRTLVIQDSIARIIHERFCCNRRSAAATSLWPAGSIARVRIGSSRLRAPVSRRGSAISRRTVMNNAG